MYELAITEKEGKSWLWDPIRKRHLVLTPEEYVRQCLIRFLSEEKGFPLPLMSIERGLTYNQLAKRYDLVAWDREGKPLVAIECKRPTVALTDETVRQLATYNQKIGATHLLITNGKELVFFGKKADGTWAQRQEIPDFESLVAGG